MSSETLLRTVGGTSVPPFGCRLNIDALPTAQRNTVVEILLDLKGDELDSIVLRPAVGVPGVVHLKDGEDRNWYIADNGRFTWNNSPHGSQKTWGVPKWRKGKP